MKAIETRYVGPSNTRGSRIIATAFVDQAPAVWGGGNRITVGYDYALDIDENHEAAAYALMEKLDWTGEMVSGGTSRGRVFVFNHGPIVKRIRVAQPVICPNCGERDNHAKPNPFQGGRCLSCCSCTH